MKRSIMSIGLCALLFFGILGFAPCISRAHSDGVSEPADSSLQAQSPLPAPANPRWKDGGGTVAAWDAVEGTNSSSNSSSIGYDVTLYISVDGGDVETVNAGSISGATEIDVKRAVYRAIGERQPETCTLTFSVSAYYYDSQRGIIRSAESEQPSPLAISFDGETPLNAPESLVLDDDGMLTMDGCDGNTYTYSLFYRVEGDVVTTGFIDEIDFYMDGTRAGKDAKSFMRRAYEEAGYQDETVQISFRVIARADFETDFCDSGYSPYSNSVVYSHEPFKMKTPENLVLASEPHGGMLYFDTTPYRYIYSVGVRYKIEYGGTITAGQEALPYIGTPVSRAELFVAGLMKQAYEEAGYQGETVRISLSVSTRPYYADTFTLPSDYSAYSNSIYYNPNGAAEIGSVTLSPDHLLVAVGEELQIGKTVSPENAYCPAIEWSSDNDGVFTVDSGGAITGVSKGNANLLAQIDGSSRTIPVTVYEIAASGGSASASETLLAAATRAIGAISAEGDTSGTDITDAVQARAAIAQAAEGGEGFDVGINISSVAKPDIGIPWGDVESVAGEAEFACAYDVSVALSHLDSNDVAHHICNLTELDEAIEVELEKPGDLPAIADGFSREFMVARIHDGDIGLVPFDKTENGDFSVVSDKFSTFVLLFNDAPCEHEYVNPVFEWADDGKSCTVTYTCSKNPDHKKTENCVIGSVVKTPATCSAKGTTTYTARFGDDSSTKDVADIPMEPTAHTWSGSYTTDTPSTCIHEGSESIRCTSCGAKKEGSTRATAKAAHRYGTWTVTRKATCTEPGSREKTCMVCGDRVSEEIAAIGHDWDGGVIAVDPTGTEPGTRIFTCRNDSSHTLAVPIEPTGVSDAVSMHRLYNPNSGEHFYTASAGERDMLSGIGWSYEGVGWTAPSWSNTPVYRMYNANGGEHHYTMSAGERDMLVGAGWSYEGIGWYSDDAQTVPLFRDYNPNAFANNHNYTTSAGEHDMLMGVGWRSEGYAWYGM